MPSLSQISSETHAVVKWGGILLVSLFFIIILFNIGVYFKNVFFPPPPIPFEVLFGKLQSAEYPASIISQTPTYIMDTVSGQLPNFPDRIKVYKIQESEPNLLALKEAKENLERAGFTGNYTAITDRVFSWKNTIPPEKTISYDILSSNFNINSNYISDQNVLTAKNLNEPKAIEIVQSFLENIGLNTKYNDIVATKTATLLYSISNNNLTLVSNLADAKAIRVNLYQADIDQIPIYYSFPDISNMTFLIAGGINEPQIVEANFTHQQVSDTSSTYPIKTADKAFEELKQGKGYIASYYGQDNNVSIKEISLGYFIGQKEQQYLEPIIVFKGDNNFLAYLPAVTDEWINN